MALGVLVAIALTVVDLYLTGHSQRWLTAPLLESASFGVHLSLADILFLVAAGFGAALTWRATGRAAPGTGGH
jgi:hypothetical protein